MHFWHYHTETAKLCTCRWFFSFVSIFFFFQFLCYAVRSNWIFYFVWILTKKKNLRQCANTILAVHFPCNTFISSHFLRILIFYAQIHNMMMIMIIIISFDVSSVQILYRLLLLEHQCKGAKNRKQLDKISLFSTCIYIDKNIGTSIYG